MEVVRLTAYDADGYVVLVTEVPAGSEVARPELIGTLIEAYRVLGFTTDQERVEVE